MANLNDLQITDGDRLAVMDAMPAGWAAEPFRVGIYKCCFARTKAGWSVWFFHGPEFVDTKRCDVATFREVVDLMIRPPHIEPVKP